MILHFIGSSTGVCCRFFLQRSYLNQGHWQAGSLAPRDLGIPGRLQTHQKRHDLAGCSALELETGPCSGNTDYYPSPESSPQYTFRGISGELKPRGFVKELLQCGVTPHRHRHHEASSNGLCEDAGLRGRGRRGTSGSLRTCPPTPQLGGVAGRPDCEPSPGSFPWQWFSGGLDNCAKQLQPNRWNPLGTWASCGRGEGVGGLSPKYTPLSGKQLLSENTILPCNPRTLSHHQEVGRTGHMPVSCPRSEWCFQAVTTRAAQHR